MVFLVVFVISFMAAWTVCGSPRPRFGRGPDKVAIAQAENRRALQRKYNEKYAEQQNAVESCTVFEIRMTQQKMVDAGIIEAWEMSICDNTGCMNCYKSGLHGMRVRKAVQPREHIESKGFSQRTKNVRGEVLNVPSEVPDHAYATIRPTNTNFFEVIWTWQDENDGKKYAAKSIHPYKDAFQAAPKPLTKPTDASNVVPLLVPKDECACTYGEIHVDQLLDSVNIFTEGKCDDCRLKQARHLFVKRKQQLSDFFDSSGRFIDDTSSVSVREDAINEYKALSDDIKMLEAQIDHLRKKDNRRSTGDLGAM